MSKYISTLVIILVCLQCEQKPKEEKIYYFYDATELFSKFENSNDTMHYLVYAVKRKVNPPDSFSISGGYKIYMLNHYYKFLNMSDTVFLKHK